MEMEEPFGVAVAAAEALARRTGVERHDVVVVLGSGWGAAADQLGELVEEVPLGDLPGFRTTSVAGHRAVLRSLDVDGTRVLAFLGRVHLYEGHAVGAVVHGVRTAVLAGCTVAILTNAAGSLRAELPVGTPVLISDHLNLTGASPLVGPAPPEDRGPRFADLTDAYSPRLRAIAREVEPGIPEGVYAAMLGGAYETPAEIRMLRTLGADLVGMSTALETIAARHLGAEVLGISLVTNLAAGLASGGLDHAEVLAAGAVSGGRMAALVKGVIERL